MDTLRPSSRSHRRGERERERILIQGSDNAALFALFIARATLVLGRSVCPPRQFRPRGATSPFVFLGERGSSFNTGGLAQMIERATARAKLEIEAHAHMRRQACG